MFLLDNPSELFLTLDLDERRHHKIYPRPPSETSCAMSKGAEVIRNLSKGLSSRTLQVTVVPTPNKFQERRAVLHALQKFAQVEVFRKLQVGLFHKVLLFPCSD